MSGIDRPINETKRTEIAAAALAVLRERGVLGVRMSHVADALEMKRPTLYWYFGSIPELFEYAVQRYRAGEAEYIGQRLPDSAGDPVEALRITLRSAVAFYRIGGLEDFLFLICQGWAAGDAVQRDRFAAIAMEQLGPLRSLLIQLFEVGIATGGVHPCDPAAVVDAALSILHGSLVHEVLTGVPAEPTLDFFHSQVIAPLRRAEVS